MEQNSGHTVGTPLASAIIFLTDIMQLTSAGWYLVSPTLTIDSTDDAYKVLRWPWIQICKPHRTEEYTAISPTVIAYLQLLNYIWKVCRTT